MPPLTILIKPVSGLCSMQCSYCFYNDVSKNRNMSSFGMMSNETLESLMRRSFEYAKSTSVTFAFQGGEPTLAGLEFYRNFIKLQNKYNRFGAVVQNTIQTNGLSIDGAWAEFLCKNNFLVGLSIDGIKAIHDSNRIDLHGRGTYSRVIKSARLLAGSGAAFNILCVVTSAAARHGAKIFDALTSMGFRHLQFIQCIDGFGCKPSPFFLNAERWGDFLCAVFDRYYNCVQKGEAISVRPFDNFIELLAGIPPSCCGYNGRCECNFVIEGNGSVYPCDFYVLDNYYMGNINDIGFAELAETEQAARFITESEVFDQACERCKWYALCRGGCRRYRQTSIGGELMLYKYCEGNKRFFEYSYSRMLQLLRYINI